MSPQDPQEQPPRRGKKPTPEGIRLRLVLPGGMVLGPGKAELLRAIADIGSISAAGRTMGMSYRRAWMLVEEMNTAFAEPLVEATRGGSAGGGARLTGFGIKALAHYQELVRKAEEASKEDHLALLEMLAHPAAKQASRGQNG